MVLAPFTYSDLQGSKRRPACVVSAGPYNDNNPDVVLAMVTSSSARLQSPGLGDFVVSDWRAAGPLCVAVGRQGSALAGLGTACGRTRAWRPGGARPPGC